MISSFTEVDKPVLCVDIKRALRNLDTLRKELPEGCKVRLSTKSIRCPSLLKIFATHLGEQNRGVMCFHPDEIKFLLDQGFQDILLAYPIYNKQIAERLAHVQKELAGRGKFFLMADLPEHLELLGDAAEKNQVELNVVVDLDVSTRLPGLHFGVHRSSISSVGRLLEFSKGVKQRPGLRFSGVMTYEAQIAGIADRDPRESGTLALVKRMLKARARKSVKSIRQKAYEALSTIFPEMDVLNGGGSGSVSSTGEDRLVNEVTIGSGILCPALFEYYDGLKIEPAISFGLPVIRKPEPNIATLFAGGYIASGALGDNKVPRMYYPKGWTTISNEGFGEVQTPIRRLSNAMPELVVGQTCFFVPAKSGECMERFQEIHLTDFDQIPQLDLSVSHKTYRGHGVCFG